MLRTPLQIVFRLALFLVMVFMVQHAGWPNAAGKKVRSTFQQGALKAIPAPDAFAQKQRLGRGVNVLGYDPLWKDRQKGRFQEKHFALIRQAGFNNVRINLHPFRDGKMETINKSTSFHAVADAHIISPAWFETLDWAVQHALATGLMVILDLHEFRAMGDDLAGNQPRYLAAWRHIAEHYKDAPNEVLFELLNEPNKQLTAELWNPLLREVLGIVRQSNPRRTVIIGPTSFNNIKDLNKLDLPQDDRQIIVTVHYYSPFPFTHQGASWTQQKDKVGVVWNGTENDKEAIVADFQKADAWARAHHRPLYLGEFGAYDVGDMDSRVRWTTFVARQAEKLGWSWAYWQFDGNFIVYDIKQDQWVEPIRHALLP
jgi:endoglucanase